MTEGLQQLDAYLDRLELDSGVLVIFTARADAPPMTERVEFSEISTQSGRQVTLLRG